MKLAGRKTVVSTRIPLRPGSSTSRASSTSRVTFAVSASGNFCTTSIRLGPCALIASPMSGWWSSTTSATLLSLRRRPEASWRVTADS